MSIRYVDGFHVVNLYPLFESSLIRAASERMACEVTCDARRYGPAPKNPGNIARVKSRGRELTA